jgi:hypothetical protein
MVVPFTVVAEMRVAGKSAPKFVKRAPGGDFSGNSSSKVVSIQV